MKTLRSAVIKCHNCGEILYGGPSTLQQCFCGNVEIAGAKIDSSGGLKINPVESAEYEVTFMQWVDGCNIVCEGSPAECKEKGGIHE